MEELIPTEQQGVITKEAVVKEVLAEKRVDPGSEANQQWLDFIEQQVLSRLAVETEMAKGESADELPEVRKIHWRKGGSKQQYESMWKEFQSEKDPAEIKNKLTEMFNFWRVGAYGFGLRKKV